jgi:hypothetical protein
MNPAPRRTHRRTGRRRLQFDRLEPRLVFSAGGSPAGSTDTQAPTTGGTGAETSSAPQTEPLTVALTDPAPGAVLPASPAMLTLVFNRPIDPTTLSTDVIVAQVADDGSYPWYTAPDQLALDATGTRLTATLDQPLTPGNYQVLISGYSGIADLDGTPLITDGNLLTVASFSMVVPGVTLADATDLGTPGATPKTAPGVLDFTQNPYAVALDKITLPAGHFWRLGLEVTAERDGGTLDSALALFDDQGRPIATDEVGRRDAPYDPYLFAGLKPGTFYVGVSGTGNLPGQPGGYDPATGSAGSVPQTQTGGPYTLHLVADPEDAPPKLRLFQVDRADPLDRNPTGLTLGFTDAIRLGGAGDFQPTDFSRGIEVVDQAGRTWPVMASDYQEAEATISYLFRERLPEGHYTVHLPENGPLVDLGGLAPVAPDQPSGVLGTFDVAPGAPTRDEHDLGALLPDAALAGITLPVELQPGASVTDRVVLTFPATYTFQNRSSRGSLAIRLTGPDTSATLATGQPGVVSGTNDTNLEPGVYQIQFTADGSEPVTAQLILKSPEAPPELLLQNGVGQGPALSLRLIELPMPELTPTPTPTAPPGDGQSPSTTPAPAPTSGSTQAPASPAPTPAAVPPAASPENPATPPAAPLLIALPIPAPAANPSAQAPGKSPSSGPSGASGDEAGGAARSSIAAAAPQVAPGVSLGLGGDLVGRPSPGGTLGAAVVPGTEGAGLAATATSPAQRVPQALVAGLGPRGGFAWDQLERPGLVVVPIALTEEAVVADLGLQARAPLGSVLRDWRVLRRAGTAVARWLRSWSPDGPGAAVGDVAAAADAPAGRAEEDLDPAPGPGPGATPDPPPVTISPAAVALAVALIALARHPMARWVRRRLGLGRPPARAAGPHRRRRTTVTRRAPEGWQGPSREERS